MPSESFQGPKFYLIAKVTPENPACLELKISEFLHKSLGKYFVQKVL